MSKRTYVDSPHDATKGWTVEQDEKDGLYYVMVPDDVMCDCGCPNCQTVIEKKMRRHTAKWNTGEEDPEGLHETIEAVQGTWTTTTSNTPRRTATRSLSRSGTRRSWRSDETVSWDAAWNQLKASGVVRDPPRAQVSRVGGALGLLPAGAREMKIQDLEWHADVVDAVSSVLPVGEDSYIDRLAALMTGVLLGLSSGENCKFAASNSEDMTFDEDWDESKYDPEQDIYRVMPLVERCITEQQVLTRILNEQDTEAVVQQVDLREDNYGLKVELRIHNGVLRADKDSKDWITVVTMRSLDGEGGSPTLFFYIA